jgi:hypothetical protein
MYWIYFICHYCKNLIKIYIKMYCDPGGGHRDRDRMAVGFTTTCTISALAPPTFGFRIPFMERYTWRPALLVEETGYTRKNYRVAACH